MTTELAIEVSGLEKMYGKGKQQVHAVRGINLQIKKGELYGFLGPNGAGKTTSLRMMIGLLEPTKGKVRILGHDIEKKEEWNAIKHKIGIIPQEVSLYEDLTVDENLKFMAAAYKLDKDLSEARIEKLLKKIGLTSKRGSLVRNLSGGQKRRINLIMSLIHDPEIVLCDEPTPGLDPQSRVVVWEFIRDLVEVENKTVVLTTHYMEEADRLADRVAIIDYGEILVLDEPDNLKNSVGEGDLLEIKIGDNEKLEHAKAKLSQLSYVEDILITQDSAGRDRLTVRCLNVVQKLSKILNAIEKDNIEVTNVKIRNTTLEDVFIDLTGRSLRD